MEPPSTAKNKKTFVYLGIGLGVAVLAGAGWYFLRQPQKLSPTALPDETNSEVPQKTPAIPVTPVKTISSGFPLKKGSTGELVKQLQRALNNHYKAALVVDGDFGSRTQSTLLQNNFPAVVDAATFARITAGTIPAVTTDAVVLPPIAEEKLLSTTQAIQIATHLKKAIENRNAFAVVAEIKKLGTVNNYIAVNELFKSLKLDGRPQTIVNAALYPFKENGTKEFIKNALTDIGLKYNADTDKWTLSGNGKRLMTQYPTTIKNGAGYSYEVPGQTLLGLELGRAKGMSAFRSFDDQVMYVPASHVRFI